MGKTEKCGDDEEEEEERKKEAKIASQCKNVYLTVVPVHCLLLVLCLLICVWLCVGEVFLFYVLCFVCRTLFHYLFLSCNLRVCVPHLGQTAFTNITYGLFYPTPLQGSGV